MGPGPGPGPWALGRAAGPGPLQPGPGPRPGARPGAHVRIYDSYCMYICIIYGYMYICMYLVILLRFRIASCDLEIGLQFCNTLRLGITNDLVILSS